MHTEFRRAVVKSEEGFTLVQGAFTLESFIGNQNTLFPKSMNSKNPEKTQPFQNRKESWWEGKEEKKNKTWRMERKSKNTDEISELQAQKVERIRSKEDFFVQQCE